MLSSSGSSGPRLSGSGCTRFCHGLGSPTLPTPRHTPRREPNRSTPFPPSLPRPPTLPYALAPLPTAATMLGQTSRSWRCDLCPTPARHREYQYQHKLGGYDRLTGTSTANRPVAMSRPGRMLVWRAHSPQVKRREFVITLDCMHQSTSNKQSLCMGLSRVWGALYSTSHGDVWRGRVLTLELKSRVRNGSTTVACAPAFSHCSKPCRVAARAYRG